jgi:UPF0176 protein
MLNISAYRFIALDNLAATRQALLEIGRQQGLGGTILLAPEGINVFACGPQQAVHQLMQWIDQHAGCGPLDYKLSESEDQAFKRWKVKIKKEIITYGQPDIAPQLGRAPAVSPEQLQVWLDQGQDNDGRPVVLLDTRNQFEVDAGAFEGAQSFGIDKFTQFPEQLQKHAARLQHARVVAYCTGGIRCEKAVLSMHQQGLEHAVQLEGGILRYFEQVGSAHWRGDLFVFDDRVGLDDQLRATNSV